MKQYLVLAIAAAAIVAVIACADESDACTGYYVGSDVSADGTVMFGQTDDHYSNCSVHYVIREASDVAGRTVYTDNGFTYHLPNHTFRYTVNLQSHASIGNTGETCAGGGSLNENGVSFTGSITGRTSQKALDADPFVTDGLGEAAAASIVGACAKDAREGATIIMNIVKDVGSCEANIFMVADQKEVWYIEVYTGHQYAAVVLPTDVMAWFGNEFLLEHVEDYSTWCVSDELVSLAKDNGFAVYDGGVFNCRASYGGYADDGSYLDGSHARTWYVHHLLSPSTVAEEYTSKVYCPLTFVPDEKVSLEKVMWLTKNRFEGTDIQPYGISGGTYCTGSYTTIEAHIFQIDRNAPTPYGTVRWSLIGSALWGVYLPYIMGVTEHITEYSTAPDDFRPSENTASGVFSKLCVLCKENLDRYLYGVENAMWEYQEYVNNTFGKAFTEYKERYGSSTTNANEYYTGYVKGLERMALEKAEQVINDVSVFTLSLYRDNYAPTVDLASLAERYGWTYTLSGDTARLTHGDDVITITGDFGKVDSLYNTCEQTIDGVTTDTCCYMSDGRLNVLMTTNLIYKMTSSDAVVFVDKEPVKTSGDLSPVFITAGIVSVICILAAASYISIRRH